jgi:multidrug efflux pump subunit AcrB
MNPYTNGQPASGLVAVMMPDGNTVHLIPSLAAEVKKLLREGNKEQATTLVKWFGG